MKFNKTVIVCFDGKYETKILSHQNGTSEQAFNAAVEYRKNYSKIDLS